MTAATNITVIDVSPTLNLILLLQYWQILRERELRTKEIEGKARQISSDLQIQEGPDSKIISYFDELVKYWEGIEGIGHQNNSNQNIVMGNGPYTHKQAKFGDDIDNLDLDLDDLGSGEISKNEF